MKQIPMCWKCSQAVIEINEEERIRILTGCKSCDIIKSYNDAKEHCPLLSEEFDVQS